MKVANRPPPPICDLILGKLTKDLVLKTQRTLEMIYNRKRGLISFIIITVPSLLRARGSGRIV